MPTIQIYISDDLYAQLVVISISQNVTISDLIRRLIIAFIEKMKQEGVHHVKNLYRDRDRRENI